MSVNYGRAMDQAVPTVKGYQMEMWEFLNRRFQDGCIDAKELTVADSATLSIACALDASGVVVASALEEVAKANESIASSLHDIGCQLSRIADAMEFQNKIAADALVVAKSAVKKGGAK